MLNQILVQKEAALKKYIKQYQKVIVSYSGGVDSSLVSFYANEILGRNAFIVLGDSPSLARDDFKEALEVAKIKKFNLEIIHPQEMENNDYKKNTAQRCFFCKQELFSKLKLLKEEVQAEAILDGTNFDDLKDFRPGLKAATQESIKHPLAELGITKLEIRTLAQTHNLPNHDKPSSPCLASRIPQGIRVDRRTLTKIELAEKFLRDNLQITPLRVRYHQEIARIESTKKKLILILENHSKVNDYFKKIGFKYVCLDLKEFKRV